ncbi:MAG: hydantoinase B/oxoprolinase family protein, partial [Planctomycetota bacterium]
MDPVRLSVFHELFAALAEEMGEVLRCTAPSVNIRERCDFSCALFDTNGALISQAAHIPVHLGSAALSVAAVRDRFPELEPGDAVLLNDPYAGGTHLPDLTLVSPVFPEDGAGSQGPWYLVNRAHHSDVGGSRPGSMAPASDLPAEGLRIPPVKLLRRGEWVRDVLELVLANTRTPALREGDLRSQVEANRLGARRVRELWERYGRGLCQEASEALFAYSARLISVHLAKLERGSYRARELLEGDGVVEHELPL